MYVQIITREEFLSGFSEDYSKLNDIYNRYQIFIDCEDLVYDNDYCIIDEPSEYLLDYIIRNHDVIWELINQVFNIDDPELDENLDIIINSLNLKEIFALFNYSINVNISKLINSITDILIDLNLYKEIDINKYYVESVLNRMLPYKITTYETN